MGRRAGLWGLAIIAAAAGALAAPATAGHAAVTGDDRARAAGAGPVAAQPAAGTPHFPAETPAVEQVRQLAECGGIMYAVGSFSVVEQDGRTYTRQNAFSFAATAPYAMTGWDPGVNGEVNTIAFRPGRCADAYLGGRFTRVGTAPAADLAEVSTAGSGTLVAGFAHSADGQVETLAAYAGHILAGGYFTRVNGSADDPYLASLNAVTGRDDGFLALRISGHYKYPKVSQNATRVYNQQISHGGTLDLIEGDFTSAGGLPRRQIFMLDLASRPRATVTGWTSPLFDGSRGYPPRGSYFNCSAKEPFYVKAAAWSPDDDVVYLADTGYRPWNDTTRLPARGLCDAAAAFTASPSHHVLKWINYTGCDSLYSVVADAHAVYFGGHERWSQNPDGCDKQGPGGIAAPGMEGLSPATGALLLNSSGAALYTRGRGLGADDMLLTAAGLWIASDNFDGTQTCGGTDGLAGICFLPYPPG